MCNLIKAEFFRIRHTDRCLLILVGISLLGVFLSFVPNSTTDSQGAQIGIFCCIIAVGAVISSHFQSRTAFYEMMDGKSPHAIILSRIVLYTPIIILCYFVPVSAIRLLLDGSVENVKFLALLLVILVRLLIFTICIVLIFRNMEGIVMVFPRIIIGMMPLLLHNEGLIDLFENSSVLGWFPLCQCVYMSSQIDSVLIMKVVMGFVVEVVFMYSLAYMSYKRKWLIQTKMA